MSPTPGWLPGLRSARIPDYISWSRGCDVASRHPKHIHHARVSRGPFDAKQITRAEILQLFKSSGGAHPPLPLPLRGFIYNLISMSREVLLRKLGGNGGCRLCTYRDLKQTLCVDAYLPVRCVEIVACTFYLDRPTRRWGVSWCAFRYANYCTTRCRPLLRLATTCTKLNKMIKQRF